MLWARLLLGGLGTLFIAAGLFWSWLTIKTQRRDADTTENAAALTLLIAGTIAYFVVGILFVAAAVSRDEWLYAAGAAVLLVRFLAFRWAARRQRLGT
jgi:hypothetical protein